MATKIGKGRPDFEWWERAKDAWVDNDFQRALRCIERYRQTDPDSKLSKILYAQILIEVKRYDDAKALLDTMMPVDTPAARSSVFQAYARLYDHQGEIREAEKWYRKALRLDKTTSATILLGDCLARQERFKEAEKLHRKACAMEGDQDEAYYNLGLVLDLQDKTEEAIEAYEQALKHNREYADARAALNQAKAELKRKKR